MALGIYHKIPTYQTFYLLKWDYRVKGFGLKGFGHRNRHACLHFPPSLVRIAHVGATRTQSASINKRLKAQSQKP